MGAVGLRWEPGSGSPRGEHRAGGCAHTLTLPGVQAGLGTTAAPGHPCSPQLENLFHQGLLGWAAVTA